MKLTDRQREIVKLMCQGMTSKEIGEKLCITERSVKGHKHRIYQRFGYAYEKRPNILVVADYLLGELEK